MVPIADFCRFILKISVRLSKVFVDDTRKKRFLVSDTL